MAEIGFVEKIKGFLVSPVETFRKVKDEGIGSVVKYFVGIALIYSILSAIIFAVASSMVMPFMSKAMPFAGLAGGALAAVIFVSSLIGSIIALFVGGAIIHAFVYLVGGRKGYTQTVKALGYGSTPGLLLGWIPFIGFVFSIWSLILQILGVRELHEISTGRAVLAVILPGIIIGLIIAAVVYVYVGSMSPTPAP